QMYGDDSSELLPTAHGSVPWTSTNPVPWMFPLVDYYRTTNVLKCPVMCRFYEQSPFNYFLGVRAVYVNTGAQGSLRLLEVKLPTQYILSGDSNYPFDATDADQDNYSQDTLFQFRSPAHNHRVNVLFADFHVRNYSTFDPGTMTYSLEAPGVPF